MLQVPEFVTIKTVKHGFHTCSARGKRPNYHIIKQQKCLLLFSENLQTAFIRLLEKFTKLQMQSV